MKCSQVIKANKIAAAEIHYTAKQAPFFIYYNLYDTNVMLVKEEKVNTLPVPFNVDYKCFSSLKNHLFDLKKATVKQIPCISTKKNMFNKPVKRSTNLKLNSQRNTNVLCLFVLRPSTAV